MKKSKTIAYQKGRTSYPRGIAVRVLIRVLTGHEPLDEVLSSWVELKELGQERGSTAPGPVHFHAWLQEVCSGTLRWKGRLDWILDSVAIKKKPSGWLRKVLLIATYQLVVQDRVSASAVVSETVDEVRFMEGEAPASFANACLRKIADHALEFRNLEYSDPLASSWASLPLWLWNKIYYQQGVEFAREFAKACLQRPTLWVKSKVEIQAGAKPGPIPGSWQLTSKGLVTERDGFAQGEFLVQDISSQYLIFEVTTRVRAELQKALGKAAEVPTALDLCAAPGGKSVGLAWAGFQVTATDKKEHRALLLKATIARVAPEIKQIPWDEVSGCPAHHLVWVDAPCSGTGIIRRHPDVRWLKEEKDLTSLTKTQRQLLALGWEKVLPGGYLVYSVCSILKEEGPQVLAQTFAHTLKEILVGEWLLSPHIEPYGDGFWAALLRKPR